MSDEIQDHNIDAFYALEQSGYYFPMLLCSCGFKSHEQSWEDAGVGMDEHLRGE